MSKNEEIDWKKVTEMEEAVGEAQKAKAKKAKLFDPKQLVTKAAQIKTMTDSELGVISFGTVVTEELLEINKLATPKRKEFLCSIRPYIKHTLTLHLKTSKHSA